MKYFAIAALFSLNMVAAHAAAIANCSSVEHHSWFVQIKDDNRKISAIFSNDSSDGELSARITKISKRGNELKDAPAASWAIRQALKGSAEVDQSGTVSLRGKLTGSDLLITLNSYTGQNFLVIGDYVEELKCTAPIND